MGGVQLRPASFVYPQRPALSDPSAGVRRSQEKRGRFDGMFGMYASKPALDEICGSVFGAVVPPAPLVDGEGREILSVWPSYGVMMAAAEQMRVAGFRHQKMLGKQQVALDNASNYHRWADKEIAELRARVSQIDSAGIELAAEKTKRKSAEARLTEVELKVVGLESNKRLLQGAHDMMKVEKEELVKRAETLEMEKSELEGRMGGEIESLKQVVVELRAELSTQKTVAKTLEDERKKADAAETAAIVAKAKVEGELESVRAELQELKEDIEDMRVAKEEEVAVTFARMEKGASLAFQLNYGPIDISDFDYRAHMDDVIKFDPRDPAGKAWEDWVGPLRVPGTPMQGDVPLGAPTAELGGEVPDNAAPDNAEE